MRSIEPARAHGVFARLRWLIPAIVAGAALVPCFNAVPSPTGMGATGTVLSGGCSFLAAHGFPCPGCGVLSSVASMARLDFIGATTANPFGVLVFMLIWLLLAVSIFGAVKKLPVIDTLYDLGLEVFAGLLLASMLVVWLVRVGKHFVL